MAADPARKLRRVARRRGEVMAIAKKMFLTRPYSQVSVEEIARVADLSKATVYSYFTDKLDIYSAIILTDAKQLAGEIHAALDPKRRVGANLRAMMRAYVGFFREHPEYFQKLSSFYFPGRERHLPNRLVREVGRYFDATPASIEKCLVLGMEHGELKTADMRPAALVIYSQWLGLTYLTVAEHKLYRDFNALVDASCDQHLAGLLPMAPANRASAKAR